jgi:hypothetical protein
MWMTEMKRNGITKSHHANVIEREMTEMNDVDQRHIWDACFEGLIRAWNAANNVCSLAHFKSAKQLWSACKAWWHSGILILSCCDGVAVWSKWMQLTDCWVVQETLQHVILIAWDGKG